MRADKRLIIRVANEADVARLAAIEDAADQLFIDALRPDRWIPAEDGRERLARGGSVLVAALPQAGAVGFAHLLDRGETRVLDQLAVDPGFARRGIGRLLLREVVRVSVAAGARELSLRTFAEIPWNAPFYRSEGFRPREPRSSEELADVQHEQEAGLDVLGARILMVRPLP